VMFDEPSLGLAPAIVHDVLKTIRELNREGLTCVLVEQNVAVSLKIATHAYVLENGRTTLSGAGDALARPTWGCEALRHGEGRRAARQQLASRVQHRDPPSTYIKVRPEQGCRGFDLSVAQLAKH
jgi:ABC-type multidrug transport system ATPase subunit